MTPEQCHEQAGQFRQQAAAAKDPAVRQQLMLMVEDWEKLAADAEELERRRAAGGPDAPG